MAASFTPGVGSSAVIPRPAINWGELSSPLETTAKKVSRHFGQLLVVLGVFAGVGRQLAAARMTASPDTIIRTCATLQVVVLVSLVVGAALWFFNRLTQAPSELLLQRKKVEKEIDKTALADLRETYKSPFVLSDAELNQWIRYLAGAAPFNGFMAKQSDKIFDLKLEDETRKVLKDRYLLDVNDEAIPIFFKSFIVQKRFQVLLSESERVDVMKLVANREAARVGVCTVDTYKTFIDAQGVSILSYLNPQNLPPLALAFQDDAKSSGVGIRDLKKNRAEELQAFGSKIETELFQQVANQEGLQPYETFSTRNGDEAVGYITKPDVKEDLFVSFSHFVVGKKDGLVKTRKDFERTIGMFGEGAPERIDFLVLTDEIGALTQGERTYLDFRRRNGIGAIEFTAFGNEHLKQQIKACFLRLPASDLIHPDYKIDRELFGITIADIRSELSGRWTGMTVAEILRTDREGFVAAVAGPNWCFPNLRTWTEKAVQETAAMSIKDILSTYRVLFETGMLVADDGNVKDGSFKDRLAREIAPIKEWTVLIDTYGAFVFEKGLLGSAQVEQLVRSFISTYAESYLNDSFEGAMLKYVVVIEKYYPVLTQTIKNAKAAVAAVKQRHADRLKGHEAKFERMGQARNDAADREIAQFQSDRQITKKEKEKNDADRECSEKKAAHEALAKELKACQEDIDRYRESYGRQRLALGELRKKQATYPANIPWSLAQAEEAVERAQLNLVSAGYRMERQRLKVQLEDLQREEVELQSTLQKIEDTQQQHNTLAIEVNSHSFAQRKEELKEKIAHPDKPVTSLKAAAEAKKEAEEAPKRLAEMSAKEEKLAELKRGLAQTNSWQMRARLTQISTTKAKTEATLTNVETQAQLPRLHAEKNRALEAVTQWKALKERFRSLLQQIANLSEDVEQLRSQIDRKTGVLEEKTNRFNESHRQFLAAEAKKQSTEIAYNTSAQKLATTTTEIRLVCSGDIEGMRVEKAKLLSKEQAANAKTLEDIVKRFRSSI